MNSLRKQIDQIREKKAKEKELYPSFVSPGSHVSVPNHSQDFLQSVYNEMYNEMTGNIKRATEQNHLKKTLNEAKKLVEKFKSE